MLSVDPLTVAAVGRYTQVLEALIKIPNPSAAGLDLEREVDRDRADAAVVVKGLIALVDIIFLESGILHLVAEAFGCALHSHALGGLAAVVAADCVLHRVAYLCRCRRGRCRR